MTEPSTCDQCGADVPDPPSEPGGSGGGELTCHGLYCLDCWAHEPRPCHRECFA